MSAVQDSPASENHPPLQVALSVLAQEIDRLQSHAAASLEILDRVDFEFRAGPSETGE